MSERLTLAREAIAAALDMRYMQCRFRGEDGQPCGECEACYFTTETSVKLVQALTVLTQTTEG